MIFHRGVDVKRTGKLADRRFEFFIDSNLGCSDIPQEGVQTGVQLFNLSVGLLGLPNRGCRTAKRSQERRLRCDPNAMPSPKPRANSSLFKLSTVPESWDCVEPKRHDTACAIPFSPHSIESEGRDSAGRDFSSDRMKPGRHDRICEVRRRTCCGCVRGFARCFQALKSFQFH